MSQIIPWTDAGGTPCCCEADCPDPSGQTTAERKIITVESYSSLYAGGKIQIEFSGSASCTSDGAGGSYSISGSWTRILEYTLPRPSANQCVDAANTIALNAGLLTEVSRTTNVSGEITLFGITETPFVSFPTSGYSSTLINTLGLRRLLLSLDMNASVAIPFPSQELSSSVTLSHDTYNDGLPTVGTTYFTSAGGGARILVVQGPINSAITLANDNYDVVTYRSFVTGGTGPRNYTSVSATSSIALTHIPSAP